MLRWSLNVASFVGVDRTTYLLAMCVVCQRDYEGTHNILDCIVGWRSRMPSMVDLGDEVCEMLLAMKHSKRLWFLGGWTHKTPACMTIDIVSHPVRYIHVMVVICFFSSPCSTLDSRTLRGKTVQYVFYPCLNANLVALRIHLMMEEMPIKCIGAQLLLF